MQHVPFYDVTYCFYGHPYKKETRIWTNLRDFKPRFCCKKEHCNNSEIAENGRLKHKHKVADCKLGMRESIPSELIRELFSYLEHNV